MRVGAHTSRCLRRGGADLGKWCAGLVEQFVGSIAFQPLLEQLEMGGVFRKARQGHLVRTPEAFGLQSVDLLRTGPALGASQHDHWPFRSRHQRYGTMARCVLDRSDAIQRVVEHGRHQLMHNGRIVSLNEQRFIAIANEQRAQFVFGNAGQDGRIGDLVAVQMQDRQHSAVARRVEKLVRVPRGGKRPGFGFAVTDDAGDDKVRIVESGAIGMGKRVTQLAALVNRAGHIGRDMARNPTRKGELPEQLAHALLVQ